MSLILHSSVPVLVTLCTEYFTAKGYWSAVFTIVESVKTAANGPLEFGRVINEVHFIASLLQETRRQLNFLKQNKQLFILSFFIRKAPQHKIFSFLNTIIQNSGPVQPYHTNVTKVVKESKTKKSSKQGLGTICQYVMTLRGYSGNALHVKTW